MQGDLSAALLGLEGSAAWPHRSGPCHAPFPAGIATEKQEQTRCTKETTEGAQDTEPMAISTPAVLQVSREKKASRAQDTFRR